MIACLLVTILDAAREISFLSAAEQRRFVDLKKVGFQQARQCLGVSGGIEHREVLSFESIHATLKVSWHFMSSQSPKQRKGTRAITGVSRSDCPLLLISQAGPPRPMRKALYQTGP